MEVILYSTHCPKCKILDKKLQQKGLEYVIFDDVDAMLNLGLTNVPALSIDGGAPMAFKEAVDWVNSLEV